MAKPKSTSKKSGKRVDVKTYKSASAMDRDLEASDLGAVFSAHGAIKEPRIKKVNLDLPEWLLRELDKEAARAGVSRQPLIKIWLIQKLEEERRKRTA